MPYLRDRAISLKKEPFREHDRRYTLYGREHGLLIAVARGSSLPKSKQAGHLEPFNESEVMIAEGKAFDKLAVAATPTNNKQPTTFRQNSGRSSNNQQRATFRTLSAYAIMGAFCDLVISLTRPGISDVRIFNLLLEVRTVCANLDCDPSPDRGRLILSGATLKLIDLLGFAPDFSTIKETVISRSDPDQQTQAVSLLKFLRLFPLIDIPRVTATADVFNAASDFVESALEQTPLDKSPHRPATVLSLLN